MDYKEAQQVLRDSKSSLQHASGIIDEQVSALERIKAFADCLPHLAAEDNKPRPRVQVYRAQGGRWVLATILTEYGSVSEDDAVKVSPLTWSTTSGDDMPHRLGFDARWAAFELGLDLYFGDELVNCAPVQVSWGTDRQRSGWRISEPDEHGEVWVATKTDRGPSVFILLAKDLTEFSED